MLWRFGTVQEKSWRCACQERKVCPDCNQIPQQDVLLWSQQPRHSATTGWGTVHQKHNTNHKMFNCISIHQFSIKESETEPNNHMTRAMLWALSTCDGQRLHSFPALAFCCSHVDSSDSRLSLQHRDDRAWLELKPEVGGFGWRREHDDNLPLGSLLEDCRFESCNGRLCCIEQVPKFHAPSRVLKCREKSLLGVYV